MAVVFPQGAGFHASAGVRRSTDGSRSRRADTGHGMEAHVDRWYRDALIYELSVRAFADGNGDGVGDFRGLTRRLDYLAGLGVTALWLLPFQPSPWRDDGYDITDYY